MAPTLPPISDRREPLSAISELHSAFPGADIIRVSWKRRVLIAALDGSDAPVDSSPIQWVGK
eukprot:269254-Rhodomonas_salina.2